MAQVLNCHLVTLKPSELLICINSATAGIFSIVSLIYDAIISINNSCSQPIMENFLYESVVFQLLIEHVILYDQEAISCHFTTVTHGNLTE